MTQRAFLIVKLAALGDVLLATAVSQALRRAHPLAHVAWLTTPYAAPLLEVNPDLDQVLLASTGPRTWSAVAGWRRQHPSGVVLLAHRARRLYWMLRAAGFGSSRLLAWNRTVPFDPARHRLAQYADLLAAAGVAAGPGLAPVLHLRWDELAFGDAWWSNAAPGQFRLLLAPGGAENPWSAMPNRRWSADGFGAVAARARATGAALCWLGGDSDQELIAILSRHDPSCTACVGLSLRRAAAVVAASDYVVGNDSLALVLAQALRRPALGVYGPTDAARIHAPGQPSVQGRAGCGPCYDPRDRTRGRAYTCPRARCMEAVTVDQVWNALAPYLLPARRAVHA